MSAADPANTLAEVIKLVRRLGYSDRKAVFRALLAYFAGDGAP